MFKMCRISRNNSRKKWVKLQNSNSPEFDLDFTENRYRKKNVYLVENKKNAVSPNKIKKIKAV